MQPTPDRPRAGSAYLLRYVGFLLLGYLCVGGTFCGPLLVAANLSELLYPPSFGWFLLSAAGACAAAFALARLRPDLASGWGGRVAIALVVVPLVALGFEAALWANRHLDHGSVEHHVKVLRSERRGKRGWRVTVAPWRLDAPPLELDITREGFERLNPPPHRKRVASSPSGTSGAPSIRLEVDPDPVVTPARAAEEITVVVGPGRLGWEWLQEIVIPEPTAEVTVSEMLNRMTPAEREAFDRGLQERLRAVEVPGPP